MAISLTPVKSEIDDLYGSVEMATGWVEIWRLARSGGVSFFSYLWLVLHHGLRYVLFLNDSCLHSTKMVVKGIYHNIHRYGLKATLGLELTNSMPFTGGAHDHCGVASCRLHGVQQLRPEGSTLSRYSRDRNEPNCGALILKQQRRHLPRSVTWTSPRIIASAWRPTA